MERILALDVGDARIGVAVSDPLGIIAQPIGLVTRVGWGPDIAKITEFADQYRHAHAAVRLAAEYGRQRGRPGR